MLALQTENAGVKNTLVSASSSFRVEYIAESVLCFVDTLSNLLQVFLVFLENVFDLFLAGLALCIFPEFALKLAGFLPLQELYVALVVYFLYYCSFLLP